MTYHATDLPGRTGSPHRPNSPKGAAVSSLAAAPTSSPKNVRVQRLERTGSPTSSARPSGGSGEASAPPNSFTWTPARVDRAKFLWLHTEMSLAQIADDLGTTPSAVGSLMRRLELPTRTGQPRKSPPKCETVSKPKSDAPKRERLCLVCRKPLVSAHLYRHPKCAATVAEISPMMEGVGA